MRLGEIVIDPPVRRAPTARPTDWAPRAPARRSGTGPPAGIDATGTPHAAAPGARVA